MDKIERLRELEKDATPAPWDVSNDRWIAAAHFGVAEFKPLEIIGDAGGHPNAALIAEARNALPLLLDVVEAAAYYTDETHEAAEAAYYKLRAAVDALIDR